MALFSITTSAMLHQSTRQSDAVRRLEVHAEALLGAIRRRERRVHRAGNDRADEVDGEAALDLDDLGAVLGEQAADLDAGDADAEIDDAQAGERMRGRAAQC